MKILKKENWFIWFIMIFFTYGLSNIGLAGCLDAIDTDAWYLKWAKNKNRFILLSMIILVFIIGFMFLIYETQILNHVENNTDFLTFVLFIISLLYSVISVCFFIAVISIFTRTAAKLEVKGSEIYLSPYIWCGSLIIPFIGWAFFASMLLYVVFSPVYNLSIGKGEKI